MIKIQIDGGEQHDMQSKASLTGSVRRREACWETELAFELLIIGLESLGVEAGEEGSDLPTSRGHQRGWGEVLEARKQPF